MKRTSFLLASLTAIVLLSCSSDNLNPLAEDVNLSQTQALQKVIPNDEAQQTCYTRTYTNSQTMTAYIDKVGSNANSGKLTFSASTLPTNAIITNVDVYTGSITNNIGTVLVNYLKIEKGTSSYTMLDWNGIEKKTLTTPSFNGLPARDTYYVLFNATCFAGGNVNGLQVNFCSRQYSGVTLTIHYCQP